MSIDFKSGLDVNAALDRALQSAAENIEGDLKRNFYPRDDTRWFDWPSQGGEGGGQFAEPWRLYLDENDLTCLTSLVSGGVTIPLTAIFPGPANNPQRGRPYYSRIELDRSQSYFFGNNAQTPQLSIAITATWGYGADADPAGILAADVGTTDTTVTVSDGSKAGPGDLIILGYGRGAATGSLPWAAGIQPFQGERVLITDVTAVATGLTQSGSGVSTASASDQALSVTGSGSLTPGEVIVMDQEDMLVEQVVNGVATVRRSWNGTTLATHSAATIYAFRQFTVSRAQLGTTAGSYSSGAAVNRHRVPPLIRDLAIAEATGRLLQEGSGYARTVGSGEAAHPAPGIALADLWDECRIRHGRKARSRGV
jgi:hypothetical protein